MCFSKLHRYTKTECGYFNGWIKKWSHMQNLTKDGEPQRSSWGTQKKKKKKLHRVFWDLLGDKVEWLAGLVCCDPSVRVQPWWIHSGWSHTSGKQTGSGETNISCECISGTNLHRQFYVLPHWDRSCRSNFLPHPVTVYWHQADQSQCRPYNARRLAG